MKKIGTLLALIVSMSASLGWAGSLDWGISPSARISVGAKDAKPAIGVDGRVYYNFNDYWALGTNVGYTYQSFDKVTIISVTPGVQLGTTWSLLAISLRPYISGGVGYYRTKYSASSPVSPYVGGGTVNNVGAHAGGGFNFSLPGFVIGADVRYERIFQTGADTEYIRPSLNIGVPF